MRLILTSLSALLVLVATACPAKACINDREVNKAEREFKSSYMTPPPTGEPVYESPPEQNQGFTLMSYTGLGLLVCATVITWRRPSKAA